MDERIERSEVAIVGAGPIGLEVAAELKRAGVSHVQFDKGQIGATIQQFPEGMTFFSSPERLLLAGMPIQTVHQTKATKEQYLAYLRSIALAFDLQVRTHERVVSLRREPDGVFRLESSSPRGRQTTFARNVVLCTGDMARPRRLGIPGEELAHVSHFFRDPHTYFRKRLLIVGGRNSAVEAALRCYHAAAHVSLSYRRSEFDGGSVKYWLLPELKGRIRRREIAFHGPTVPTEIGPTYVALQRCDGSGEERVDADFVLLLVGYEADMSLFEMAGAEMGGPDRDTPQFDDQTMQTSVEGLYVAGTATAGTQSSGYRVFIENCHIHARRIAASITGAPPPPPPAGFEQPES